MKAKKKLGTKAQIRAAKERERRVSLIVTVVFLAVIALVSGFILYSKLFHSSESSLPEPTSQFEPANFTSEFRVAIVDHLSLTAPNEAFIETAAAILTEANYTVDYFSGEKVTVDFYRNLPTGGYQVIILRVHSALNVNNKPPVALFTSELLNSRKHVNEQLTEQIQGVTFIPYNPGDKAYFGILPKFVKAGMNGDFQDSVIIAMGCDGLTYTYMAEAFIEKGAKVYIGWDDSILGTRNDPAIICLLRHLITEKQIVEKAVADTMKEFGPIPIDNSVLLYYPPEAGDQTIEDIKNHR